MSSKLSLCKLDVSGIPFLFFLLLVCAVSRRRFWLLLPPCQWCFFFSVFFFTSKQLAIMYLVDFFLPPSVVLKRHLRPTMASALRLTSAFFFQLFEPYYVFAFLLTMKTKPFQLVFFFQAGAGIAGSGSR